MVTCTLEWSTSYGGESPQVQITMEGLVIGRLVVLLGVLGKELRLVLDVKTLPVG